MVLLQKTFLTSSELSGIDACKAHYLLKNHSLLGFEAWCEDRNGTKKSFSFSERNSFHELILVSSRNHRDERLEFLIQKLYELTLHH